MNREKYIQELMDLNEMDRNKVKEIILKNLNNGNYPFKNPSKWFISFKERLMEVYENVSKWYPELYNMKVHSNDGKDPRITSLNLQFCIVENEILFKIIKYIEDSYSVSSGDIIPCFDGFLIPKGYVKDSQKLVKNINNELSKWGYKIRVSYKPMVKPYQFVPIEDEIKKGWISTQLDRSYTWGEFIETLNYTVFDNLTSAEKFLSENMCRCMVSIKDPVIWFVNKDPEKPFKILKELTDQIVVSYYTSDNVEVSISLKSLFREHPRISRSIPIFVGLTNEPNPKIYNSENFKNKKLYNTWTGYQAQLVDRIDEDKLEPILHHIKYVLCKGSQTLYNYVMSWFKILCHQPWVKVGVVLLIIGEQGSGKTSFFEDFIMTYVIGLYCGLTVNGIKSLTDKFNIQLQDKSLIIVNEMGEDGFGSVFEKLKTILTDKYMSLEPKGVDKICNYPSYHNYVFTTNTINPVHLIRGDRRFCVLKTSSRYIGNKDYFDRLHSSFNQEVADMFFTHLYNFEQVSNIRSIPMTSGRRDMMLLNSKPIELFLHKISNKEYIPELPEVSKKNRNYYTIQEVYTNYIIFVNNSKYHYKNVDNFETYIRQYIPQGRCQINKIRKFYYLLEECQDPLPFTRNEDEEDVDSTYLDFNLDED
jgi:hypothetical protein